MKALFISLLAVLLIGCSSLYTQIVTVTKIRDSAMKELAALSKQGKITPATDAKIAQADAVYRQAAETAQKALIAYQASPSTATNYTAALQATKLAVSGVLDILAQFVAANEMTTYRTQLTKANKL